MSSNPEETQSKAQDNAADASADLTVFVEQLLGDMVRFWHTYMKLSVAAAPWRVETCSGIDSLASVSHGCSYSVQQQKFQQMSEQIIGRHILACMCACVRMYILASVYILTVCVQWMCACGQYIRMCKYYYISAY